MSRVRVGDIRASQLLYTFGVGSLINLPQLSVLVMGLDDWDTACCREITEERLLAAARRRLGGQVSRLLHPPVEVEGEDGTPAGTAIGAPVTPFPRWARCPRCDLLAPLDQAVFQRKVDPYRPERTRYVHSNCQRANEPPVMPVRFMLACRNGHLEDFPWAEYVHRAAAPCTPSVLRLKEYGVTGDPADIVVQCDTCNARRRFVEVVGPAAEANIPACRSSHPHLRSVSGAACSEPQKVVVLGASNAWFPVQLSALALPASGDTLRQLVEEHWATLSKALTIEVLKAFRAINQLPAFAGYTDEQLWAAVQARAQGAAGEPEAGAVDLKGPEWEILSGGGAAPAGADFRLREVAPPQGFEGLISRTVLAERLREVRVLLGFTRIESPGEFSDGEDVEQPRMAPLSRRSPTWLPATEVRGEGLFIQFREEAIRAWCAREAVKAQEQEFAEGHARWRGLRRITPPEAGFPGIRYVLLHSFAHALMRQLALECGYAASSVRERIYARDPGGDEVPMAGVLIYTGAPDSEGTLGGLVNLGRPETLGRLIEQTLEQMRLCASDPLCSERRPADDELTIHGAACHACLFAPETACERGNRYLDRSVLVRTFSSLEPGFFDGQS
jgi:hypothetical protein